jgi:bacterioferritin
MHVRDFIPPSEARQAIGVYLTPPELFSYPAEAELESCVRLLTIIWEPIMTGNQKVIDQLNAALAIELTAIVQYMAQSEMCESWGYARLGGLTKARAIEEMKHAEGLIERIIFLGAIPAINVALTPNLGKNIQTQLEIDLADELQAVKEYNEAISICREANDDGSRSLFEKMIKDEERHADFLESQLHAIQEMGLEIYLSNLMRG